MRVWAVSRGSPQLGRVRQLRSMLLLGSVLLACRQQQAAVEAARPRCDAVTEVAGRYLCSGECVVTGADGTRELQKVSEESDTVERYPGAGRSFTIPARPPSRAA